MNCERLTEKLKSHWAAIYANRMMDLFEDFTVVDALDCAYASLENIDFDYSEDPIDSLNEELSYWVD